MGEGAGSWAGFVMKMNSAYGVMAKTTTTTTITQQFGGLDLGAARVDEGAGLLKSLGGSTDVNYSL